MTFRPDALAGQHIIISGGAGAIGVGIIKKLTDHGARMIVNDILEPGEVVQRLQAASVNRSAVHYVQGDLTQQAVVDQLMTEAREVWANSYCAVPCRGSHSGVAD